MPLRSRSNYDKRTLIQTLLMGGCLPLTRSVHGSIAGGKACIQSTVTLRLASTKGSRIPTLSDAGVVLYVSLSTAHLLGELAGGCKHNDSGQATSLVAVHGVVCQQPLHNGQHES